MNGGTRIEEILDYAIEKEQEAVDFYTKMADRVSSSAMKAVFKQFAGEERGHKAKLQGVKGGKNKLTVSGKVPNMALGDYLVAEDAGPDISYQDALILAMKREKASYRLYTDLAKEVQVPEIRELLLALAQEEARHKLRFEVEYDENILKEN
ncbi:MAG: ferritin family protein [Candidatus Eisenbacteria bacterium]